MVVSRKENSKLTKNIVVVVYLLRLAQNNKSGWAYYYRCVGTSLGYFQVFSVLELLKTKAISEETELNDLQDRLIIQTDYDQCLGKNSARLLCTTHTSLKHVHTYPRQSSTIKIIHTLLKTLSCTFFIKQLSRSTYLSLPRALISVN